MMNKIINLLFVATCLYGNYAKAANVYSDEKPQNICVLRQQYRDAPKWEGDEHRDIKLQETAEFVETLFISKGMVKLPKGNSFEGKDGDSFFDVYGKFEEDRLVDCLAVEVKHQPRSLMTRLGVARGWTAKVDPDKLWHINSHLNLDVAPLQEGSWNFISNSIHVMNRSLKDYDWPDQESALFLRRFYERVRRRGLENSLYRVVITSHDDSSYTFNVLYNNDQEREAAARFVTNLF